MTAGQHDHATEHPDLGCADVGCYRSHEPAAPPAADYPNGAAGMRVDVALLIGSAMDPARRAVPGLDLAPDAAQRLAGAAGYTPGEDPASLAAKLSTVIAAAPGTEAVQVRAGALALYRSAVARHGDRATDLLALAFNGLEQLTARMGQQPRRLWADDIRNLAGVLAEAAAEQAAAEALRSVEPATEGRA